MSNQDFKSTVVVVAVNSWDGVRMADRQLADALTDHCPVLYVDPPTSILTRRRRPDLAAATKAGRLQVLRPGLARLAAEALPGLRRPAVASANAKVLALQIKRAVRALGGTLNTVIDAGVLAPVLGQCGEKQSIYWAQDDFVGAAPLLGLSPERLRRGEKAMARLADVIVAANQQVASTIMSDGYRVELIPFGCDYDHFASTSTVHPADEVKLERPTAVFMGHVGDRIDPAMLAAVADRGINLLVVGPQHGNAHMAQFDEVMARPNVQWVGGKDFEDLPAYLAHADIGILPYNHSRFNEGSFPLKTLEYLAAGLPVVASDLPAIRWLDTPDIVIADDPGAFSDAVERLLERGRDLVGDDRRRSFARQHSWSERATAFARLIQPGSQAQ